MAWTKPTFFITLVFISIIFFVGIVKTGEEFVTKGNIDLTEDSLDYLNTLKGQNEDAGFNNIRDTEMSTTQNNNPLEDDEGGQVSTDNDFLSTFLIKKERASQPVSFFQIAYNIPTSLLLGLGLPVEPFAIYINIFGAALFIGLVILLLRYILT